MGMISEEEAWLNKVCVFCEKEIDYGNKSNYDREIYRLHRLCRSCWEDFLEFDGHVRAFKEKKQLTEQGDFQFSLSGVDPIPIESLGALNIGWLVLYHPRVLIGSHISVEDYGLTAKFTIIPPTAEASEKIVNTIRTDRENRNKYVRPGNKGNAPARYTL